MSRFTARSKSVATLLSVLVVASAMLAPAAIAAPASAGNSFEIPVISHGSSTPATALHRVPRHRSPAAGSADRLSAGNSFEIPLGNGRAM